MVKILKKVKSEILHYGLFLNCESTVAEILHSGLFKKNPTMVKMLLEKVAKILNCGLFQIIKIQNFHQP